MRLHLAAGLGNGTRRRELIEDTSGLACGDLLADAARNQLAQHRMQAAGDLVAGPGQVPVPLGPHLQHRGVILGPHLPPGPGAQRRDRDRQGVIRIVLVGVPGLQQPHPGGQLRRHIEHPLPGSDQLLGQQVPQAGRALHRPGPLRPGRRPGYEPPGLSRAGPHPQLAQRLLGHADRHRRVRALVRIDADHHCCHRLIPFIPRAGRSDRGGHA